MSTSYAQCSSASIKSFVQFFAIFPRIYTTVYGHNCIHSQTKGQLKPKTRLASRRFSQKRTDEFFLFGMKSKKAKKTKSSVRFLGEFSRPEFAFEINSPLHSNTFFSTLQLMKSDTYSSRPASGYKF